MSKGFHVILKQLKYQNLFSLHVFDVIKLEKFMVKKANSNQSKVSKKISGMQCIFIHPRLTGLQPRKTLPGRNLHSYFGFDLKSFRNDAFRHYITWSFFLNHLQIKQYKQIQQVKLYGSIFMDGVQLSQDRTASTRRVYFSTLLGQFTF